MTRWLGLKLLRQVSVTGRKLGRQGKTAEPGEEPKTGRTMVSLIPDSDIVNNLYVLKKGNVRVFSCRVGGV